MNGNFAYEDSEGDFPNFERDGLELVVDPTAATNSVGVTYRDRVDRSTTQSIYHSEAPSLWMVREKNGLTHFYGNVPDKSVPEAVLRDELGVSQWLIVRSVDPFGNAIDYTYVAGEQRSDLTQLQLAPLLLRIEYGANLATGSLHNSSHFVVNSK